MFCNILFVEFNRSSFLFPGLNLKSKTRVSSPNYFFLKVFCFVSYFYVNGDSIQKACMCVHTYIYTCIPCLRLLSGQRKWQGEVCLDGREGCGSLRNATTAVGKNSCASGDRFVQLTVMYPHTEWALITVTPPELCRALPGNSCVLCELCSLSSYVPE